MEIEKKHLHACLELIEAKLNWGASDKWATKDFQNLSDQIFEVTNINLSVATLKRVWGKVTYQSQPAMTTLDALAQFIGFANWRIFQQNHPIKDERDILKEISRIKITEPKHKRPYARMLPLIAIAASLAIFLGWTQFGKPLKPLSSLKKEDFQFSSKKMVTEGVPNSVIFEYDARAADEKDTIYIQQSWDKRLRAQVSKTDNIHTSIYYHPGYFKAKLVVRDSIMSEHDLFIKTKGWLPLVETGQRVPVYFSQEEAIHKDGRLYISEEQMKAKNIVMQPTIPWVNYYYMNDLPGIDCRNFILETRLKNTYKEGAGICQNTTIEIRFAGGVFVVPLSIKGCVSDLRFMDFSGPVKDVSKLGVDFTHWVKVKLEVKDGKGQLFINDVLAYDLNFDISPLDIKGVRFLFEGGGMVDDIAFKKPGGEIVFEDSF